MEDRKSLTPRSPRKLEVYLPFIKLTNSMDCLEISAIVVIAGYNHVLGKTTHEDIYN